MKKITQKFKFKSRVIVWKEGYQDKDDSGLWRFARVPENISGKIKEMQKGRKRRGWGAVYARAKVLETSLSFDKAGIPAQKGLGKWWTTSIFPVPRFKTGIPVSKSRDLGNRHSDTYILPLKKQIRYEENLYDGVEVKISIEIWF